MKSKNYLDIIGEDLLNYIFDIVADLYEEDINKISKKNIKVKKLIKDLDISKIDEEDYKGYFINYGYIGYSIDNYLFSKYPIENVIIIHRYYNVYTGTDEPPLILQSKLLKSPLYLDILREINKIFKKQTKILGYVDNHTYLEVIGAVEKNDHKYYNINLSRFNKYNYIYFDCGS
jgi:hypothetical protein